MSKLVLSVCKHNFFLFFLISLLFLIGCKAGITGHAVASSKASIINSGPVINSVNTFSLYVSSDDNIQEDNFTICSNKDTEKVHINVEASDADGFGNIINITFKIVLLSGTTESDFNRFGNDFIKLTFESGSSINAIYKYAFNMSINDSERKDPLFYRIKSKVSDGISTSATLDANYTFIKETCGGFTNDSFIAIVNETTIINGTQDADTSIEIVTNATVNGSFSIIKTTFSPVSFTDFDVVALNKYIDITLTPVINRSLTSIKIKILYTDAEVSAAGIEESSLGMYNWNGTNWIVVDNSTVDTINNFVSGTVEHFSLYALFGNTSVSVAPSGEGKSSSDVASGVLPLPKKKEPKEEKPPAEKVPAEEVEEEVIPVEEKKPFAEEPLPEPIIPLAATLATIIIIALVAIIAIWRIKKKRLKKLSNKKKN